MTTQEINTQTYYMGYNDYIEGSLKVNIEEWNKFGFEGEHSYYCAGFEDAQDMVRTPVVLNSLVVK